MTDTDMDKVLSEAQIRAGRYTLLAQVPFGLFAIGGMVAIIALKYYSIDQLLITAIAVGFILVYCITVAWAPVLRIREDQLGDNCYYLGFLYTLASLVWALYKFSDETKTSDIIGNFGLALGSTIAGVLLRVIINQARKDILQTDRDARMQLTEAMTNMRVQLDAAVIALRAFCADTQNITAAALRENTQRAHSAIDESVSKIGETSNVVLARIDEAFSEFSAHSKKLNQVASGTVKALENMIGRLEKMEPPSDLITRRIDGVMVEAERAGALLRERLEADEKAVSEAASRIKELEERLKTASGWISAAGSGLGTVSEVSLKAGRTAEEAAQKLSAVTSLMSDMIGAQEKFLSEIRSAADRGTGSLLEHQDRLVDRAKEGLDHLLLALKQHNDGMAEELERTRRMTSATGNALADMAEAVTDRTRAIRGHRAMEDAAE